MATSFVPFSVVVDDIAARKQREGTVTGLFFCSCAENSFYVFGLAQKSRTAILRCYSVVSG
jgi:hypothetical protein